MRKKLFKVLSVVIAFSLLVCDSSIVSLAANANTTTDSKNVYLEDEENVNTVSGNEDNATDAGIGENLVDTVSDNSKNEVVVNDEDAVVNVNGTSVSGTYYGATWSIDENGNFVLTGNITEKRNMVPTWDSYKDSIRTAKFENLKGLYYAGRFFANCKNLESFTAANVESSDFKNMSSMFENCSSLTSVDFSNIDTSNVESMNYTFSGCESLKSIKWNQNKKNNKIKYLKWTFRFCSELTDCDVSCFDIVNATELVRTFENCASLESINVANWNTENVTYTERLFAGCKALKNIDLSKWNTSKFTSFNGMFSGCKELESVDITNFDTRQAENLGFLFSGCKKLTSINISNIDTSNAISIIGMFEDCESLKQIDITHFDTSKVEDMQKLFRNCKELTSIDLSQIKSDSLKNISEMFSGCVKLENLNVLNIDTKNVVSMEGVFRDCDALEEIDIHTWDTSSSESFKNMFAYCEKLSSIILGNMNTSKAKDMSYMFCACDQLKKLDVSGFDTSNVTNMSDMFSRCSQLETLDVSGFDTSNVTNMGNMFSKCSQLETLDVSGFDTSNVTKMNDIFNDCIHVEALDVSGFDTSNVTDMQDMFGACLKVEALDVSGFDTSNVTNMKNMFGGCQKVEALDVSGFDTSKVTDMSRMFFNCSNLKILDVSKFKTDNVTDMSEMFGHCRLIESLDVAKFKTSNVKDMSSMFYNCEKLNKLNVSRLNTSKVENMNHMFAECVNLSELDLSSFDTSNVTNMNSMFYLCKGLKEIDLKNWGSDKLEYCSLLFDGCTNLEYVDLSGFNLGTSKSLRFMFNRCNSLEVIDLSDWDISGVTDVENMLYCNNLKTIYTPKNRTISIELPNEKWIVEGTNNVVRNLLPAGDESICLYVEGTTPIDISEHKIIFMPNGGEFYPTVNPEIYIEDDETSAYKIVKNHYKYGFLPKVNKDYYKFMGWWTSVDGGEQITSDTIANVADEQTLYAHWAHCWKVTYDANGGQIAAYNKTVVQGETYGKLSEPNREGHSFAGWYTEKEGGKLITEDTVVDLTEDITIYAHWRIPHIVTFDANGGIVSDTTKVVYEGVEYGELPEATREGYTFAGWYTEKEGGNVIQASTVVSIKNDQTLYAHWTVNVYEVTLETNGGKTDISVIKVTYDSKYNNLPVPVRPGYTFEGWFTSKVGGDLVDNNTVCKIADNHSLYAHWTMQHIVIKKQKQNISGLFNNEEIKGYYIKDKKQRKLASVSKKGVISAKKAGKVTVTAYKLEKKGKKKVKVDLGSVDFVLVNPKFTGKNKTLKVNLSDSNNAIDVKQYIANYDVAIVGQDNIKFKSTKEEVATIDSNGMIKLVGKGKTNIKVTFEKNGKKVTVSFKLKVSEPKAK